jgi:energy-coupling factor transporter ATP-binding protein EcfA2
VWGRCCNAARRTWAGTILTIAHRLPTIIDYDRVIVMDAGVVAEDGAPAALLRDPQSLFSGMVASCGPGAAAFLRQEAGRAEALRAGPGRGVGSEDVPVSLL